jgi:hypothetical protein
VRWDAQGAANERSACGHQDYSLWGFTMKMSKLGYFSEFLLFPPLVLLATLLAFRSSNPPQPAIWVLVYGIGLFGWTFIEYLLHRVLFHHAIGLSNNYGDKYTLYSLRHFYAVGIGVFDVARNMDTSVQVIQNYYGKHATPMKLATQLGG